MVDKINKYTLNYVVNLDEQYLTKELIQLKEQADEMMKSEIMQKRVQDDSARMEEMEKSGWRSRLEQIEEQIRSVAPQFFPNIKEKVIEVTEAISEPDIKPEEATKKIKELENELASAHNIIKQQRKDKKDAGAEALAIRRNKPATKDEMVAVIDRNRKLNGKCNNEAIARELGWKDGGTIKKWIEGFKLSDYAYNPDRIATFNRKKK